MKSIKQQIKEQPDLCISSFLCFGLSMMFYALAFLDRDPEYFASGSSFAAAAFVINAIMDKK